MTDPIQVLFVGIIAALAGIAGAAIKSWIEQRTGRRLGLPSDTEKRIIDLREELIAEQEREIGRRVKSEEKCLAELLIEVGKREALEHRVDDLAIQNTRLLRRLGQAVGQ